MRPGMRPGATPGTTPGTTPGMGSGARPRQGPDDGRATLCPHRRFTGAPCGGTVLPTGHCAVCGRAENGPRLPALPEDPREFGPAELLALPERVPRPAQERLIHPEAPLRVRMSCSSPECGITFAPPYTVGRVPVEGYCPACGEPYSYRPELAEGDVLRDQYRIMGPIAHGGQGWVYLAEDTHLGDVVAVKGMLNRYEQDGARLADVERRNLVAIRHPRIVQIRDFVARRDGTGQVTGGYIVMDDVGDGTLEKVVKETRRGESVLDIEHVAAYGCQILEAFVHLHAGGERAFVYGDMKPSNVVHHGDGVKVIDLGGMREQGQSQPPAHVTPDYMAPETAFSPMPTTAHDLHTVGVTLRELAGWAVDEVPGLGTASFRGSSTAPPEATQACASPTPGRWRANCGAPCGRSAPCAARATRPNPPTTSGRPRSCSAPGSARCRASNTGWTAPAATATTRPWPPPSTSAPPPPPRSPAGCRCPGATRATRRPHGSR